MKKSNKSASVASAVFFLSECRETFEIFWISFGFFEDLLIDALHRPEWMIFASRLFPWNRKHRALSSSNWQGRPYYTSVQVTLRRLWYVTSKAQSSKHSIRLLIVQGHCHFKCVQSNASNTERSVSARCSFCKCSPWFPSLLTSVRRMSLLTCMQRYRTSITPRSIICFAFYLLHQIY